MAYFLFVNPFSPIILCLPGTGRHVFVVRIRLIQQLFNLFTEVDSVQFAVSRLVKAEQIHYLSES